MATIDLDLPTENGDIPSNYTSKQDDSSGFKISTLTSVAWPVYVYSGIACFDRDCRVIAMRKILPSPADDLMMDNEMQTRHFDRIVIDMPGSALDQNPYTFRQSEGTEVWIIDSTRSTSSYIYEL
jgi:hypothetical protein